MKETKRFIGYAEEVAETLDRAGLRCEIDGRAEKIGYKIREAQLDKVPYMVIIGQKEVDVKEVSVRSREAGDVGSMSISQFLEKMAPQCK